MTSTDSLVPFWRSGRMQGESLLFVEPAPGQPATCALLLPPSGPVSIESTTGEIQYVETVDYVLDRSSGLVTRTPGSRIPLTAVAELRPSLDPDGSGFMHIREDPAVFVMVAEDDTFHRRQVAVSYSFDRERWTGYAPSFAGAGVPRTIARLRGGEALTMGLLGDSISEGYNASSFIGAPPHQPSYGNLVAAGLEHIYGTSVTLHNFATAGWTSDDGLGAIGSVAAGQPDLVLIAFGMNDAGYAEPADYAANLCAIVDGIRGEAPHAELILVSSMLPNPIWHYPRMERFAGYRQALADLCGPGIILADVTRLWTDVMTRKSPYDLTGNGINHPNDFGHRLYAHTILSLLVE
jgi:lysophospholipase L1-like esterase